jgi:ankyrin repeat protein
MQVRYQSREAQIEKEALISRNSKLIDIPEFDCHLEVERQNHQMALLRIPLSELVYFGQIDREIVQAILGHYDSWRVKYLIELRQFSTGINVNAPLTVSGLTPISLAYTTNINDRSRILTTILELGANPNTLFFGQLSLDACASNASSYEELLKNWVELEVRGRYGKTALFTACSSGSLRNVELLVGYGADIERKIFGQTMITHAARYGHTEVVKYLKWIKRRAWVKVFVSIKNVDSDEKIFRVMQNRDLAGVIASYL